VSKPTPARAKLSRLKAIPWAATLRLGVAFVRRLAALSASDRRRLSGLLRQSRGRPGNLSARERDELLAIIGRLDLLGVARELGGASRRGRRYGRR
jgi:hypothetical protein